MKKYLIALTLCLSIFFMACDKDNFDGPNASFFGEIRDIDTGELIEQEAYHGSQIKYIEGGWANPQVQSMSFKEDGSFRNNLMFSGTYKIILDDGNFVPLDTIFDFNIKNGDNFYVFNAQPYIRILNASIEQEDNKIVARFTLEQTTIEDVRSYGLVVHTDAHVSHSISEVAKINKEIDRQIDLGGENFEIELDLSAYSDKMKKGNTYFFRVYANSRGGTSKYNYSAVKAITL